MSDPKEIYLQPECCADPATGRLWCEDDSPEDCEDGASWTKYVLADEAEKRIARLQEQLDCSVAPEELRQWKARVMELEEARDKDAMLVVDLFAKIAELEQALQVIRDSTYRDAVTLRGLADVALLKRKK